MEFNKQQLDRYLTSEPEDTLSPFIEQTWEYIPNTIITMEEYDKFGERVYDQLIAEQHKLGKTPQEAAIFVVQQCRPEKFAEYSMTYPILAPQQNDYYSTENQKYGILRYVVLNYCPSRLEVVLRIHSEDAFIVPILMRKQFNYRTEPLYYFHKHYTKIS
jgi:hypothetical protein